MIGRDRASAELVLEWLWPTSGKTSSGFSAVLHGSGATAAAAAAMSILRAEVAFRSSSSLLPTPHLIRRDTRRTFGPLVRHFGRNTFSFNLKENAFRLFTTMRRRCLFRIYRVFKNTFFRNRWFFRD